MSQASNREAGRHTKLSMWSPDFGELGPPGSRVTLFGPELPERPSYLSGAPEARGYRGHLLQPPPKYDFRYQPTRAGAAISLASGVAAASASARLRHSGAARRLDEASASLASLADPLTPPRSRGGSRSSPALMHSLDPRDALLPESSWRKSGRCSPAASPVSPPRAAGHLFHPYGVRAQDCRTPEIPAPSPFRSYTSPAAGGVETRPLGSPARASLGPPSPGREMRGRPSTSQSWHEPSAGSMAKNRGEPVWHRMRHSRRPGEVRVACSGGGADCRLIFTTSDIPGVAGPRGVRTVADAQWAPSSGVHRGNPLAAEGRRSPPAKRTGLLEQNGLSGFRGGTGPSDSRPLAAPSAPRCSPPPSSLRQSPRHASAG